MPNFGPYVLLEHIARGGMADLYRAKMAGAGGFEKTIALKRMRPEYAKNPDLIRMFIEEAKLSSRLVHGNIAQVITLERVGDDWALVLEYVEGLDLFRLERILEEHDRRLSVDECVHIVKEILIALDFVHRLPDANGAPLGLVHCDVSPANVMVNTGGEVKLIDFGIARSKKGGGLSPGHGGKVRYRAPEQVRGESFDLRADIYSVGVVLWELLAGERIYEGKTLEDVLDLVRDGRVPEVSSRRPDLPESLATVLHRALYPEPHYRYAHAAAFLRALEDLTIASDPARSRHVLSEIIRAMHHPVDAARTEDIPLTVADDSLEHALDSALED